MNKTDGVRERGTRNNWLSVIHLQCITMAAALPVSLLLITTGLLAVAVFAANTRHPVILVPGLHLTRLMFTVDRSVSEPPCACPNISEPQTLWLNTTLMKTRKGRKCFLQSAILYYDLMTRSSVAPPGVKVTTPPFGQLDGVEWVTPADETRDKKTVVYGYYVQSLVQQLGYKREKDILGAPMDWRRAPNENKEFLQKLKRLIEKAYVSNGNTRVIVITHSLGTAVSYVFLRHQSHEWRNKYLRSCFLLSSILGGSFKSFFVQFADNALIAEKYPITRIADRFYSILPFVAPRVAAFGTRPLVTASNGVFTAADDGAFYRTIKAEHTYQQFVDTRTLYNASDIRGPSGDYSIHCIAGFQVPTRESATFIGPLSRTNHLYTIRDGDGDGHVNAASLRKCYDLACGHGKIIKTEWPGMTHDGLLKEPDAVRFITNLIRRINSGDRTA